MYEVALKICLNLYDSFDKNFQLTSVLCAALLSQAIYGNSKVSTTGGANMMSFTEILTKYVNFCYI